MIVDWKRSEKIMLKREKKRGILNKLDQRDLRKFIYSQGHKSKYTECYDEKWIRDLELCNYIGKYERQRRKYLIEKQEMK